MNWNDESLVTVVTSQLYANPLGLAELGQCLTALGDLVLLSVS